MPPSATGPPAAARPRHARPTWQRKELSAKELAPTPNTVSVGHRKKPSRGRLARSPQVGADPRGGRGFNIFGGVSLPGFFGRPAWGFMCMEGVFSGDATSSPPRDVFSYPRVPWPSARASNFVPTCQWFEPRLLIVSILILFHVILCGFYYVVPW